MRLGPWFLCVALGTAAMAGCPEAAPEPYSDPCATSTNIQLTLGCNGPVPGAAPDHQLGAFCVPDPDDEVHWGSCQGEVEGEEVWCYYEEDDSVEGVCVISCEAARTYVSTGGCPTGHRCLFGKIDDEEEPGCFADCQTNEDCGAGLVCHLGERICYPPNPGTPEPPGE